MKDLFTVFYEEGLNIPTGAPLEPLYNSVEELEEAVYEAMEELRAEYCNDLEGAIYFEEHYDMLFEDTYYELESYLIKEVI